jgi:UDP-GlcNAc:undecaprenyl-phosphate GlcNAc-1-phosphate transferase
MSKFIPLILASGLISFIATPLLRRLAISIGFVDNPAARKLHVAPMPMMGGLAIYLGLTSAVALSSAGSLQQMIGVIGGGTIVTLVGLLDDRFALSPVSKLIGQFCAVGLLLWSGITISLFSIPWLDTLLTFLWVVGIINAINFLDNMDGLAAGIACVACGFFLILAVVEGLGLVAALAAATLGASVAFLYYNFNPASLFMGDAGSMLLGFILAVLGIKLEFPAITKMISWLIPLCILGVPLFDTTLVVISRIRRGKPVYKGGKDHTSHRFVTVLGMTHTRAVFTLYLINVALGLTAIMLRDSTLVQGFVIMGILALIFLFGLIWLEIRFKEDNPATSPEHQAPL